MREKMKKKKNIIIGGLLAFVFLMAVGYAAFATSLNITGTGAITNSWNILITNITSTATGTATDTTVNKQPNSLTADISAELVSPGDKVTYEITVSNTGSLNAKLESLTMTESNNEAVIFTKKGIEQGSVLNSNQTATLIVTIEYNPEVTEQPSNLNASTTITFNYVQSTEEYDELYTIQYMSKSTESSSNVLVLQKQVHFDEKGLYISPEDINLIYAGYRFLGWNTKASGAGIAVVNNSTYSELVSADKTVKTKKVYAQWAAKPHTLKYDTDGGKSISNKTIYWTSKVVPEDGKTEKVGYTLDGWYTEPNGSGTKLSVNTSWSDLVNNDDTITEKTIYAYWIEN